MRLIDREAAIEAIRNLQLDPSTTQYIYSSDAIDAVKKQPAVDAVPLEPLCEWLADELHVSVDCGIDHCDNCDAYDGTLSVKGCWMKLIKEQVMEEHNGTDNP